MQEDKVLRNEKRSRKGQKELNGEDKILSALQFGRDFSRWKWHDILTKSHGGELKWSGGLSAKEKSTEKGKKKTDEGIVQEAQVQRCPTAIYIAR